MSEYIIKFGCVELQLNDKIPAGEIRFINPETITEAKRLASVFHLFFTSEKDALDHFLSIAYCDSKIINIKRSEEKIS